jgi:arsenate reductase-like glutaredoxin family protein
VSKFRALSEKDWVQKLALPPPSEKISQEGYIKSLLIDWARDIEAWRTHLTIAGNQFKEFNCQVEGVGRRSVEIWLWYLQ